MKTKNLFINGLCFIIVLFFIGKDIIASSDKVSIGIKPYFIPGGEIRNAIGMRYKFRVDKNESKDIKILFSFKHFYTPGNPDIYHLESNLYNYWIQYENMGCKKWPEPYSTSPKFDGQSGLWLSVPDYNYEHKDITKRGRVGVRKVELQANNMFPNFSVEIDAISGLNKIETMTQMDITGKDIGVIYTRGDTFVVTEPIEGWGHRFIKNQDGSVSCSSKLPVGTYRIWNVKAIIDNQTYNLEFALPNESAQYFAPHEITSFITEFFGHSSQLFKIYLWDLEIQRENSNLWEKLNKWEVFYHADQFGKFGNDSNIVNTTHGPKISTYNGHEVIEFSNDGTNTYYKFKDVFSFQAKPTLQTTPEPAPTPMITPTPAPAPVTTPTPTPAPAQVFTPRPELTPAPEKDLNLIYPNGGEILKIGKVYGIKWSGNNGSSVRFELYNSNGKKNKYAPPRRSYRNRGSINWKIPKFTKPGQYKLKIICSKGCDSKAKTEDESDNFFTIVR